MKTIIAILVVACVFAGGANADNYGGLTASQEVSIKKIITSRFGNGYAGRMALCIANRESGYNPRAANWNDSNGGSHGLFQINGAHRGWVDFKRIYNPRYNTAVAWRLSRHGTDWGPWGGRC